MSPASTSVTINTIDKKGGSSNFSGDTKPQTPGQQDDTLLFGVSLARLSPTQSFLFLAFGALFCALTFAALQEKVFLIEGNPGVAPSSPVRVHTADHKHACPCVSRAKTGVVQASSTLAS